MPPALDIPFLPPLDVAIAGGSTAAVAVAHELSRQGLSCGVFHAGTGFGEESAGALEPVPVDLERGDPLIRRAFADVSPFPIWPGGIKRAFDGILLEAGVSFQYLVRPVALLHDADGAIAGLILAARTSLYAVRVRAVIDATQNSLLARMAGVPFLNGRTPQPRHLNFVATSIPRGLEARTHQRGDSFEVPTRRGPLQASLMDLTLGAEDEALPPAAREAALRTVLYDASVCVTAARIRGYGPEVIGLNSAEGLVADPERLPEVALQPVPGLMVLGEALPFNDTGAVRWERPDVQVAVARRAASLLKETLPDPGPPMTLAPIAGNRRADGCHSTPAFLRKDCGALRLELSGFPIIDHCDVLVAGGGTGGACAGIAAAREGAKTIVTEIQHGLGGVGTLGLIASYYFGNRCGFTAELNDRVAKADPDRGSPNKWNPELKMALYGKLLHEAGGQAWFRSFAFGVRKEGERVSGVLVSTPFGAGLVECGAGVDATGNADLAAAAGAPCRVIDATHAAIQGTGLSPRPVDPGSNNTDHTFIDDTDPEGITFAFAEARAKFPDAFDTSPLIDSRERRQILGELELSPLDFLAERTFPDTITTAASNFDTHGFTIHPVFLVLPPDKKQMQADVPFRCLLPRGVEGILVTGLGVSAHRDALPVIRMQADVQNQGFAAGIAAAWSAKRKLSLRGLDIRELQKRLVRLGILDSSKLSDTDSFPLPAKVISEAARRGPFTFYDAAILFAHESECRPILLKMLEEKADADRRLGAAVVLGLMGEPAAAPHLARCVDETPWDEGWNYRGMGQFGQSVSPLDAKIIALATAGGDQSATVIARKAETLHEDPEFSHCRALAMAAGILRDPTLAKPLASLLKRPGMSGHTLLSSADGVGRANSEPNDNDTRNRSLRELYLARGLFHSGDDGSLGRHVLEAYANDLRGLFARHARAVLADPDTPVTG